MSLIDATYFEKGLLYIPNNTDMNTAPVGSPTNQTDLDVFIANYEREFLLNALGITLYEELQIAIPLIEEPANLKWKNLINGVTYTNSDGVKKRWDGLLGFNKQSVIAFFIYTEYLRNYNETFATTGVVRNESKNAISYSATPKFVKAYNEFLLEYQSGDNAIPVLYMNQFGTEGIDWYASERTKVSLYQFLIDSNDLDETAFPDFEFKFYREINSFGI